MSVWALPTYKTTIARELYKHDKDLFGRVYGKTLGPYLHPDRSVCGLDVTSDWEELADKLRWKEEPCEDDAFVDFIPKVKECRKFAVGTEAIYKLIGSVYFGRFSAETDRNHPYIEGVVKLLGDFVMPSTQISPDKFLANWAFEDEEGVKRSTAVSAVANGLKKLRASSASKNRSFRPIDQKRLWGESTRNWYGISGRDMCILVGAKEYVNTCLIFSGAHMSICSEALDRIARILEYVATLKAPDVHRAPAIIQVLDYTVERSMKAGRVNSHKVCKAFHKARGIAQMRLFANENYGAIKQEIEDFKKDGLDSIIDLDKYLSLVEVCKPGERLDFFHVYKWMPSPDFDVTSAFGIYKDMHQNTRKSGLSEGASERAKEMYQRVVTERKFNIAAAYHAMTGTWPPLLSPTGTRPTKEMIEQWDPKGLFPYYQYGKDVITQIKDKACVMPTKRDELNGTGVFSDKKFLLWYMANSDNIDTVKDLDQLSKGIPSEDNYVRVAYKAEGHKPDSRLFFMAPPRTRILLGEMEGNLSKIARVYPGSLQGRTAIEKDKMIKHLMDLDIEPPNMTYNEDVTMKLVMFDCSKFSPKSCGLVTEEYHKFWAGVFGVKEIEDLYKLGPDSDIIHTTEGLKMEYKNCGADLEGFRGRMMTMFHADMLGATCRMAKEEGLIDGKGVLAVFIDDGAIKLAVNGTGEKAEANINRFLNIMQEIYASAGQDNNASKTCISSKGAELLAEVYLNGKRLPCGIKAAMRIYPDHENPAVHITEEFDAQFSSAQGAVKDGCDWIQAYKMYARANVRSIFRWVSNDAKVCDPTKLALQCLLPKSYGGFGFSSLQGLVTTGALDLTSEGMGMINRVGRYYPMTRSILKPWVRTPIVKRDPLSILRDPTRVRAARECITENRLTMRIVRWLEDTPAVSAKFFKNYRCVDLRDHATAVAEAILSGPSVSITMLARAWKCTPLHFIESVIGKFKRAATIIELIGYTAVGNIRRRNMRELTEVLRLSY